MSAKKVEVEYGSKEVELSREYPFGEKKEIKRDGETDTVTVLTLNELNGYDDEVLVREEASGKIGGYVQFSISAGITYDEALMLANKDRDLVLGEIQGF